MIKIIKTKTFLVLLCRVGVFGYSFTIVGGDSRLLTEIPYFNSVDKRGKGG